MTLEEALRLIDPATDIDEIDKIIYYHGFNGKKVAGEMLREASQMVSDYVRWMSWHDAVLDPPRIPRDEKRVGPFLVTDGKRKPYEAYYASLLYRNVHVCRWVKSDYPGMMPYPLGKDEVLYWMKWPEPPEKEKNED